MHAWSVIVRQNESFSSEDGSITTRDDADETSTTRVLFAKHSQRTILRERGQSYQLIFQKMPDTVVE